MIASNYQIVENDSVLAMITNCRGEVVAQVNSNGYSSIAQLVSFLRSKVASVSGMFQLFIRNFSKGWHLKQAIYVTGGSRGEAPNNNMSNNFYKYC